jgi:hypothetical protein
VPVSLIEKITDEVLENPNKLNGQEHTEVEVFVNSLMAIVA